jgi:hypothetical protein
MRPFLLSLLLLAGGCAPGAYQASPFPEHTVLLPGVQLEAPAGDGWTTIERSAERVVLSRTTSEVATTLTAHVLPVDASSNDEAFMRAAEAEREAEVGALEMVSVHYNGSTLRGATCLAYDGIYRDPLADPARQFRMRKGYVCRHPEVSARAVRMELAFDAESRTPPEAEALIRLADAFFGSVAFSR